MRCRSVPQRQGRRGARGFPDVSAVSAPVLNAGLSDDTSGRACAGQFSVVVDVLFGAGLSEVGDGVLEAVALAEVGGDGDPIAAAGMGSGQGHCADIPVVAHPGGDHVLHHDQPLAIAELTYVEVPLDPVGALLTLLAEEDVAGCLDQMSTVDYPFALVLSPRWS